MHFLVFSYLLGGSENHVNANRTLWKTSNAFSRQFYTATMSRDRFIDILRYIHFDDSTTREERKSNDKLAPLRDITNIFAQNCKDSYDATAVGCVDEQLVTFRGRCSFKVYMPSKPGKYGIKIWTLCDSKTFYCCNMQVYLGKQGKAPEKQQGQRVVKEMTDFWRNSGRCVTTDNFFHGYKFGRISLRKQTFFDWNYSKKYLPKILTQIQDRCVYSSYFLFTETISLVSYIPKPRKCIVLLSTLHREHSISTAAENFKPEIINYYNSTKSGVDALDKLVREYSCRRCTRRWPLSLFIHYIDIAAYNALVIWHTKNPTWEVRHSSKMRRKLFLEELAKKLTAKNIDRRPSKFENEEGGLHANVAIAIEATERKIVKKKTLADHKRDRCCFCVGNNNKYQTVCDSCQKYVCKNHCTENRTLLCNTCTNIMLNKHNFL